MLATAAELLEERGYPAFTVDEVARRSGASKATIYKHWTGGFDLAVEAYGVKVTGFAGPIDTGDVRADLTVQILLLAALYASRQGHVVAQLLAGAVGDTERAELVRRKFFGERRNDTAALIDRAKADGRLRPDVDTQLCIDMLFGPIVFRLVNGMKPIGPDDARELARMSLRAILPSRDATTET